MSARTRLAAVAAALSVVLASGCGEDEDETAAAPEPSSLNRLTPDERRLLSDSEGAILDYCRQRALSLTDADKRPTAAQQADALEGVDAIVGLAAEKPLARIRPGVDLRLYAGDLTENLEGSNCDPLIVGRLQEGLASLPAP